MIFKPFEQQKQFLRANDRIRAAVAGKRSGKTEVGAIQAVISTERKEGFIDNGIDPYVGVIIAPTIDMLRRLSLMKFLAYARPFDPKLNKSTHEVRWQNGAIVYGISADKPERLEGIKANWVWCDEALQMPEQIFTEALARVADTKGKIWITGSLGVQYRNPKAHWVYRRFKEKPIEGSRLFEWTTADNPYFPSEEMERLKNALDPVTFKQLFTVSWDVQGTNLVYDSFSEANVAKIKYNPQLETYFVVDWGWTHKMACLYFQYDTQADMVYLIDEIVSSKLTLEALWEKMKLKPYRITDYYCDIAGKQEREQTGLSNVAWFRQSPRNIHFKYRSGGISHGIALMRSYIKNLKGQVRFVVDESCVHFLDEIRNYSYPEADGSAADALPIKHGDDAMDAARYFFLNRLDFTRPKESFESISRWKLGR